MQIIIDGNAATSLDDADNFKAFSVSVPTDVPAAELGRLVVQSGAGQLDNDGNHVHVAIDVIRQLAVGRGSDGWSSGFEAMIAYARTKGWVDDAGNTVRAHLERS